MDRIDASSLLAMRSAILRQNAALSRAAGVDQANPQGRSGQNFTNMVSNVADALGAATAAPVAAPGAAPVAPVGNAKSADFATSLKQAIGEVNELQARAGEASEAYERGETTDIAAVMLARESANVGFQATLQVRNKLLAAYKDIMSMPV